MDATDLNLNLQSDKYKLWARLKDKQPFWCNWYGSCYDSIVGFLPDFNLCSSQLCTHGWTYGKPATIVMTTNDMQAIVAHEIGHTFGLGDEYGNSNSGVNMCGAFQCNVNPPPSTYCGRQGFFGDCSTQFRCIASVAVDWPGNGSGSSVLGPFPNLVFPYEVGMRGDLGNKLSFMGSGEDQENYWVTPDVYNHLFDTLPSDSSQMRLSHISRTQVQVVRASGSIGKDDSVELDAWYTGVDEIPLNSSGEYVIEALDGQGHVLASHAFALSFLVMSDPPFESDQAYFDIVLPMPSGTQSFQLRHSNNILTTVAVSVHPPQVTLISPNGGEKWVGGQMEPITWSGSDLDGDGLVYTVEYTPDGINWRVLATNLSETTFLVDTAEIPGGNTARVRVIASDGVHSAQDDSDGDFSLPNKSPEVFILGPDNLSDLTPGTPVFLVGSAYDAEDLDLSEDAYMWSSDVDGFLGIGREILVMLTPGLHRITLAVTDSRTEYFIK